MIHKIKSLFQNNLNRKQDFLIGKGSVLYDGARIINNLQDDHAIEIGEFTHIKGELLTFGHGGKIKLGQYCFLGEQSRIWSSQSILIGDRVLISHNVNIFDNNTHPISAKQRHQQFKEIITTGQPKNIALSEKAVTICDDVLIGCMAIILKGVTLNQGSIIGAGSIVTKDVPPWTIVAGNPARIIREIPEDER